MDFWPWAEESLSSARRMACDILAPSVAAGGRSPCRASGAGVRIRSLGYPPRKALRAHGRACGPAGRSVAIRQRPGRVRAATSSPQARPRARSAPRGGHRTPYGVRKQGLLPSRPPPGPVFCWKSVNRRRHPASQRKSSVFRPLGAVDTLSPSSPLACARQGPRDQARGRSLGCSPIPRAAAVPRSRARRA